MDDKTELLAKIDFLAEYQRIGIQFESTEPNAAGWVPCHSIDRDDRNASAAVNLQNGFYTDLGNGGRKLDFFALMQILGGFRSFLEVLNHYRKQFGMEEYHERKNAKNRTPETEFDILPWNPNGDRWCGLKATNRDAVERAGGFLCRYRKQHICVGFQVFADPDPGKSATGYVVAQTDGTPLPKFDKSGAKIGEAKYKIVTGTQTGLVGTEALLAIAKAREEGTLDDLTVVKVEGISDLTALLARIPTEKQGKIVALTNACGAGEKPKDAWKPAFEGVHVVVVHDSDKPGQTGVTVWCQWLEGTAKSVKNVVLPYEISENHGKDLKDFLTEHTFEDFLQLVENAQPAEIPDPNEIRKKILEALDIEPIGEYPDQSIAVFSRNGRKLVTIKDVDKLSFTRLLQIAGEPVFKHLDEKDPEGGTITLTDVRNALAMCCRENLIVEDSTKGQGIWLTHSGKVLLVGKGTSLLWD